MNFQAIFGFNDAGRRLSLALTLIAGLLVGNLADAQSDPAEYDLKAAFVYQFLSYVSWPEAKTGAPDDPLRIGVVGAPELAENLVMLAITQKTGNRAIEVYRLQPDDDPRDLHVLFVAADRSDDSSALLRTAIENSVLTITENTPRSPDSVINFEIIDDNVRFDVALGLAQQHAMDISARLLQVALRVMDQP